MLTRDGARQETRPRMVRDHRYGYRCLFRAICPAAGTAAGHVCDRANAMEMNRHLLYVSAATPAGRHARGGSGWRYPEALEVPDSVSLLPLPPDGPELNPVETVLQTLKARHFANQVMRPPRRLMKGTARCLAGVHTRPDRLCRPLEMGTAGPGRIATAADQPGRADGCLV